MSAYFVWSLVIGSAMVLLGRAIGSRADGKWDGPALFMITIGLLFLADRLLLVRFGLPLWVHDSNRHYRHRPNAVRIISRDRPDVFYRINRFGFHDDDFPQAKPPGEFRMLLIGDSVTMGYGVPLQDTFASRLEERLNRTDRRFRSHQVINAGVHGYSSGQELMTLRECLVFQPELIVVGFCLNDVTEPFVVDAALGGTGLDYHGIFQSTSPILGYLSNETGIGRLAQQIRQRAKSQLAEKRLELYNVKEMVRESDTNHRYIEAWKITLSALEQMYQLANQHGIPLVLVIFPFDFQLVDATSLGPKRKLREHAAGYGVDVIDLRALFFSRVFDDPELLKCFQQRQYTPEEIVKFFHWKIDEFFFDQDHFTARGHDLIAGQLLEYLQRKCLIGEPSSAP
jgi:lysophospholipase L1-like esterase